MPAAPSPAQQLVRLSGADRPGITAAVLAALDRSGVVLHEMDQLVVRGNLTLDLLVDTGSDVELPGLLGPLASELGVRLEVESAPPAQPAAPGPARAVVTVIAPRLTAGALAAVTGAIASAGANIARIVRLAHRPVCAFEFRISGGDAATLRTVLLDAAASHGVDVAVEVCGNQSAVDQALRSLRIGGRYVIAGLVTPGSNLDVDANQVTRNYLTISGIHNYHPRHLEQALQFLGAHSDKYPYAELVGARFSLDEINDAVQLAASEKYVRVAVCESCD